MPLLILSKTHLSLPKILIYIKKKKSNLIEIHIEDDGPGIPEDEIERLFKPFQQLSRQHQGAGLGLAIAKKIIETHGGILTIENKKTASGLCVKIALPIN